MNYLFGPVNSRRLGISLGIDLIPFKTCTLNCIYCECGNTSNLTSLIDEYAPINEVITELKEYLSKKPSIDILTFSGSGEPTLHGGIGSVINFIKDNFPEYRVAVLTNGTLLYLKDVRRSIQRADIIMPSLDAVNKDVFEKILKPAPGITPEKLIDGLIELRNDYKGKIVLEIFIIPEFNNIKSELEAIREACLKIKPDLIQLNTLDRPGSEEWLEAATMGELNNIKSFLKPLEVEIIRKPAHGKKINTRVKDITDDVLSTIERRPSTLDDLSSALGIRMSVLTRVISSLLANDIIEEESAARGSFYKVKRSMFC